MYQTTQVSVYTEQILNYLVKSAKSQQITAFGKNHGKRLKSRLPWFRDFLLSLVIITSLLFLFCSLCSGRFY